MKELIKLFLEFDIQRIPRIKNSKANALSKLVALLPLDLQIGAYLKVLQWLSLEAPRPIQQVEEEEPSWIDPP